MANMMSDKHISATAGLAGVFWVVGLGLMVAGTFDLRFMGWGIWATAVGAVLTGQKMLCAHHQLLRDAFEMGREVGREGGSIKSIR